MKQKIDIDCKKKLAIDSGVGKVVDMDATKTTAKKFTWALYLGTKLIAEGEVRGKLSDITKPSIHAAYADADAKGAQSNLFGSAVLSGYRLSAWGPRGGNVLHMVAL